MEESRDVDEFDRASKPGQDITESILVDGVEGFCQVNEDRV